MTPRTLGQRGPRQGAPGAPAAAGADARSTCRRPRPRSAVCRPSTRHRPTWASGRGSRASRGATSRRPGAAGGGPGDPHAGHHPCRLEPRVLALRGGHPGGTTGLAPARGPLGGRRRRWTQRPPSCVERWPTGLVTPGSWASWEPGSWAAWAPGWTWSACRPRGHGSDGGPIAWPSPSSGWAPATAPRPRAEPISCEPTCEPSGRRPGAPSQPGPASASARPGAAARTSTSCATATRPDRSCSTCPALPCPTRTRPRRSASCRTGTPACSSTPAGPACCRKSTGRASSATATRSPWAPSSSTVEWSGAWSLREGRVVLDPFETVTARQRPGHRGGARRARGLPRLRPRPARHGDRQPSEERPGGPDVARRRRSSRSTSRSASVAM